MEITEVKKPSIKEGKKSHTATSRKDMDRVRDVLFMWGLEAASELELENVEDIVNQITDVIGIASEAHKSKARRKLNKFHNSTFGAITEVVASAAALGTSTYLIQKGARKFLKKRKSKKLEKSGIGDTDSISEMWSNLWGPALRSRTLQCSTIL